MRLPLFAAFLLFVLLALPRPAAAWGPAGHQQVGAIADQLIAGTPAASRVQAILGGLSLQTAAVWGDCAKGVKAGKYQNDPQAYPECIPFNANAAEFESFVLRNPRHSQYHYTDISNFQDHYDIGFVGARNSDVVYAINAAITRLRGQTPAAPFDFSEKEALMLLAHYAGDVHQPLHVVALYLDEQGRAVDPDHGGSRNKTDTVGGNRLMLADSDLHTYWDAIPPSFRVGGTDAGRLLQAARQVPPGTGDLSDWTVAWAGETIAAGRDPAFKGLSFSVKPDTGRERRWEVAGMDATYRQAADDFKFRQLARGGARLAQLLLAIWPEGAAAGPERAATPAADGPNPPSK